MILDASAMLALINKESGYRLVKHHLPNAIMSAVNLSEVTGVLMRVGNVSSNIIKLLNNKIVDIIPFDAKQANMAAKIKVSYKKFGISLGDSACLALATLHQTPVLSADQIWKKLDIDVDIQFSR